MSENSTCTKVNEMYIIWKMITVNKFTFNALDDLGPNVRS